MSDEEDWIKSKQPGETTRPAAPPAKKRASRAKADATPAPAAANEVASEVVDAASPVREVAVLGPLEKIQAGLDQLAAQVKPFDLTTLIGEKDARAFRALCVTTRTSADGAYEAANRPMLALQKKGRELRDAIKTKVLELETPVDEAIKAVEQAREAERERKLKEIAERNASIRRLIAETFMARAAVMRHQPSSAIEALTEELKAVPMDDERWGDLKLEAIETQGQALGLLDEELGFAKEREEKAAQLEREREQLEEQRKKDAEERRKAEQTEVAQRKLREANEAAERKKREEDEAADRKKHADAMAARQVELDAMQKKIDEENAALRKRQAEQDERDRIDREKREAEDKQKREKAEAEEREARRIAEENSRVEAARMAEVAAQLEQQNAEAHQAPDVGRVYVVTLTDGITYTAVVLSGDASTDDPAIVWRVSFFMRVVGKLAGAHERPLTADEFKSWGFRRIGELPAAEESVDG